MTQAHSSTASVAPNDHRSLMPRGVMFSPELCSVFGICGGLLVQQVHYWCMDRKNLVDGHYWVWNSTKEWANQLQVFDERTVKSHLKSLRTMGVLITANHNRIGYDRTLWYRIDYPRLTQALVQKFPTMVFQIHDPLGNCFTNLWGPVSQPIPETISETTTESILVGPKALPRIKPKLVIPLPSGETPEQSDHTLNEVPPMAKMIGSAKEILAAHQLKKNPTKASNTSGSLQAIWRREVPKAFAPIFIPEFTIAERGQFASIARNLTTSADDVVTHVVRNWVGYTKHVASAVGLHKTPDLPHVGFLLKYVGHAKGYVLSSGSAPVKSTAPKKKVPPMSSMSVTKNYPVQLAALDLHQQVVSHMETTHEHDPEASVDDVMAWKPK